MSSDYSRLERMSIERGDVCLAVKTMDDLMDRHPEDHFVGVQDETTEREIHLHMSEAVFEEILIYLHCVQEEDEAIDFEALR